MVYINRLFFHFPLIFQNIANNYIGCLDTKILTKYSQTIYLGFGKDVMEI